jgi:hypothetical protein
MKLFPKIYLPRRLPISIPLASALLASSLSASAAYTFVGFPATGGTTFTGSGSTGSGAGRTGFYSGFDESQYQDLAWSFITIPNPYHSSEGSSGGNMTYSGYNPATGVMTWNSTSNATWTTFSGTQTQNIATRLVLQFQPYTGIASGLLASGWITPTTAATESLAGSFGGDGAWPLIDVDATGAEDQFQIWYRFETSTGVGLLDYYNISNSDGGSILTSTTGGFFLSVPEPSTALLGGIGLLALLRRRRA